MSRRMIGRFLLTAASMALLWVVLNRGDAASWVVGLPSILIGAWLTALLPPPQPWRISPAAALGFVPFFLWNSLRGAWDVTWRALRPGVPIRPGFVDYRLRLPRGPARVLFLDVVTLLPGTLSADVDGDIARVHAIDLREPHEAALAALERRVARLFGLHLKEAA